MTRPDSRRRSPSFQLAAFLLILAFAPRPGHGQTLGYPVITRYSGTETGVHGITFDTAQDKDGVLYFGGTSLLSFDGDRWKKWALPGSYAIRSLSFAPDGKLWAGAMGDIGWFEKGTDSEWAFHSLRHFIPREHADFGDVFAISADGDGVTAVTTNRIFRWTGRSFEIWFMPTAARKILPTRINGRLLVHWAERGIYEVDARGRHLVLDRAEVGASPIVWIEQTGENWLFGSSRGLFSYDGTNTSRYAPEITDFLAKGTFSCATRLPDGRLAIGTLERGIAFLRADGSVENILDDKDGLPSNNITSLRISKDGDLWVTSSSHILRINIGAGSQVFDERAGLPAQTYRKISRAKGSIFVANESRAYELRANSNEFVAVESLDGRWQDLRGTRNGLVATGYRGALLWDGSTAALIARSAVGGIAASAVSREDPAGLLLVDNPSIIRTAQGAEPITIVQSLPDPAASLAEDLSGRIWIGTLARGLMVAEPQSDVAVNARNASGTFGLPTLSGLTQVRTNTAGKVVVFSNQGAWHKPPMENRFAPIVGFQPRNVAAVSEMAEDGTLWVALENTSTLAPSVGRVLQQGTLMTWEPYEVDQLFDVGAPRSIYAESTPGGTVLWIGGTNAVLRHRVDQGATLRVPRPPLLKSFVRHAVDAGRQPILAPLPYDTAQIEFEFAAPEFSRRALLRLETRIEGIDHDWMPLPAGSRRELTGVRDGRYTVRARVVAETGVPSEETRFSFEVLPPSWRTAPFIVGVSLLLLPLGYGGYVWRIRTLRRRNAELEQKVRERTEELVAANAAKTQFVANMSHDIRNPLNGIVGLALALEDTRLAPRQQEIVATLRECTTYLSSLVDDVLDFASIEAGRVELRPRSYAAAELLRSIAETMKAEATSSGAVLSVAAAPDLPATLFGDAGRIQQILVNFVSNALKYAGGAIRLSAHAPANSPGEVEFAVTDEGPGLTAAEQATLFTKFSRLRQQRGGEEIPGAGLGLASCRLLADIMGGSVGVESQPGNGARFFLRLPLTIAAEAPELPVAHLPHTSVLLVEDTDYNAWAATAVLARLGLTCERARTGAEALQLFSAKRFNVVLLDRNLPDMDGTEVARKMREMEGDQIQAVLLAVTAYCTAEDRELCLRSGMDAFVGKPLTPEKLRNVLIAAGRRLLAAATLQAAPELPSVDINTSLLAYLSDGSAAGLQTQFDRFLASLDQLEAEINSCVREADLERLRTAAHRLLGQAKMVGAAALSEVALQLEHTAGSGEIAQGRNLLPRIRAEIQAVTEAMHHRRPSVRSK